MKTSRNRETSQLRNGTILFVTGVLLFNLFVLKIPFNVIFNPFLGESISKDLNKILHGFILIGFSIYIIKKLKTQKLAGINQGIHQSWLFIIPLIFPCTLALPNLVKINMDALEKSSMLFLFLATQSKGLAEEFIFRGVIQSYLLKKYWQKGKLIKIIAASSLMFALIHIINLTHYDYISVINQVISAFFMGVFFSALLLRTNNIVLLGILHGLVNFLFKLDSLPNNEAVGSYYEKEWAFISVIETTIIMSPLLIVGLILLKGIDRKKFFRSDKLNSFHYQISSPSVPGISSTNSSP